MILSNISPSNYTFTALIKAYANLSALKLGKGVHCHVLVNGYGLDLYIQAALVALYAKCGDLGVARKMFDKMPERSVVAWNSMISGYEQNGFAKEAIGLFYLMREVGVVVTVLSACAHGGLVYEGRKVFVSMKQEYGLVPRVEHHVCMVDMLGRAGLLNDAYWFIKKLILEEPDPAVWTAMLGACKIHKNFDLGVQVAEHLLSVEPENLGHYVIEQLEEAGAKISIV